MPETRTMKMTIEYDGAGFAGWQVQPDARTVQAVVEEAISTITGTPQVRVTAAGRTDAGVHARGQVVHFETASALPAGRLLKAFNGLLPPDVTVTDLVEAPRGFNARFDAVGRSYRYTLSDRRVAIGRGHIWHVRHSLSRELLAQSTAALKGPCDLRGFSKQGDRDDFSTILSRNRWTFEDNCMIFDITAVRFFHHAVRSIVGTAVDIARGRLAPDTVERILATGDRSLAGVTAPARGLCLMSVDYGDEDSHA